MSVKRSLCVALGGALLCPTIAGALEALAAPNPDALTLNAPAEPSGGNGGGGSAAAVKTSGPNDRVTPVYLDAAKAESPNVHGFASISVGSSYITPRGLVVENSGIVFQPVFGLVMPIGDVGFMKNLTLVGGIWNDFNTNQDDPNVGGWNEMDVFFSLSSDVGPVNATLTYGAWNFPQSTAIGKPETEHNLDLKIAYADKWFGPDFSVNPYVDFFYAVAGSSTVVLGKAGDTGYVEVGVVPTINFKGIEAYPITLTFPTYVSFGPSEYWGGESNFGVLSSAVNASVPLAFIPTRYGNWHADFGVQYYNLLNGTLLDAGTLLSGNTERNIFRGYVGIGFSF